MTPPPILLVAEAYGETEARFGAPLVGPSGAQLLKMLDEAGIIALNKPDKVCINRYYETQDGKWIDRVWRAHHDLVRRTDVFNLHPAGNDIELLCGGKGDALLGYPLLIKSKYVRAEFEPELDRLRDEILELHPNLIVCLGNTPLWALGGRTGVKKWRGTTLESTHTVGGYKLLTTYHPAAVLRGWELRPIVIADLMKACREAAFPEIRRPKREIWIEPTIDDIIRFTKLIHERPEHALSVDIETSGTRITCIGLGYADIALVIPFDDERAADGNYWPTPEAERIVWELIRGVLEDPTIPKLFQNGLYDIAFLWRSVRVRVLGAAEDTMLLHHALQPELEKGLGFLGSVYADDLAWKHGGAGRRKKTTIKRDA